MIFLNDADFCYCKKALYSREEKKFHKQLDALLEWNIRPIAVIAPFIIIVQPFGRIKLRLKNDFGNVIDGHILAHNS